MVTGRLFPGPGQLRLDPESVAAAGRDLAGVAQRMADDLGQLERAIGGSPNPFGGGETGGVVSMAYQAVVATALDAIGSYTEQVGFAAATLVMEARAVAAEDAEGAASLYAGATPAMPGALSAGYSAAASRSGRE
jgi:hypothetical protein